MTRGIVKSPGVNMLLASDPSRRIRTLEPGHHVEIVAGAQWLRVEVDGVVGLVPAASIESEPARSGSASEDVEAPDVTGIQVFAGGPRFVGDPIVAHVDFHPALRRLHDYAELADVKIHVTGSYQRPETTTSSGRRSNHWVGHAIDMRIVMADEALDVARLRREHFRELPANVRYWIQQIREDRELRWGGDFVHQDPAHIDDGLYGRDPAQWQRKLDEDPVLERPERSPASPARRIR